MSNPHPAITFRINLKNTNRGTLLSSEECEDFAKTNSTWITAGGPANLPIIAGKHGDTITLYGYQAVHLKKLIESLKVFHLEVVEEVVEAVEAQYVLFTDPNYVHFNIGDPTAEASNLLATLQVFGVEPIQVNDIANLPTALESIPNGWLLIPEMEVEKLDDGDVEAVVAIYDFVNAGGNLVSFSDFAHLYFIFGWEMYPGETTLTYEKTTPTSYDSLPSSIDNNSYTTTIDAPTLPPNTTIIYESANEGDAAVFKTDVEDGRVFFLAWDWNNALPVGSQDGGWSEVLYKILELEVGE